MASFIVCHLAVEQRAEGSYRYTQGAVVILNEAHIISIIERDSSGRRRDDGEQTCYIAVLNDTHHVYDTISNIRMKLFNR